MPRDKGREIRGYHLRRREAPNASIVLRTLGVGDDDPVVGRLDLEGECAFEVGLVEARETSVRVIALEMGVQVGSLVERILEAVQAGTVSHVLRGGRHRQDVLFAEAFELYASAIESIRHDRLAIELDTLHGGADQLDEGARSGAPASKRHGRGGREGVGAVGEIEPNVVTRVGHQRRARLRLLTGEVVASGYELTLARSRARAGTARQLVWRGGGHCSAGLR